ncbi:histone-fold-containing protein [Wallemia mellicola CBS 633.66]|uniref:Histone-fold-containing protein n=1 Tax=Wallemia mellicola (strain ATCC MYA-4683 / CBS 633.66) TaxID=671144 RepID=I4YK15_WALMC|nr:histone-fold-containing protein [Wallemia mellicola CBS 633.66]EIM24307.1 histone-fold-containing protein [Wallemia mellicola CBS 633.66]|eukprot:XP_006956119.1 histone-fold-containing protein [Wallemia mellicola CBS 633.66]
MSDIQEASKSSKKDFKREKGTTHMPIARVQKIIKADKEMENCGREATFLIAVATEYFIKYLTDAGYIEARLDKRNTIQYKDLAHAVDKSEELEFLKEIIPSKLTMQKALELQHNKRNQVDGPGNTNQDDAIPFEPPHKNKKKTHAQAEQMATEPLQPLEPPQSDPQPMEE